MKMKGQLDSPSPMKKHKAKSKKAGGKKKQTKLETKKQTKNKKISKKQDTKQALSLTLETKALEKKAPETKAPTITPDAPASPAASSTPDTSSAPRTRASKSLEPISKDKQLVAVHQIIKHLLLDEITQGAALRELRVNVLGLSQHAYTTLTGVSRKTLSEIENDKGNYTPEIINKVFKPFELKSSLVPTSRQLLIAILNS